MALTIFATMKRLFILLFFVALSASSCKENTKNDETPVIKNEVANISYSIVKTFPHDTAAFTQGLVIYKGQLYEGTGGSNYDLSNDISTLRKVNLENGKVLKSIKLQPQYFGEGITILNDTVYQLTWKEKVVFVYTLHDFKKVKEYPINTEGWGITTNGKELIVSDGSSNLYYYDPNGFKLLRTQSVTQNGEYLDSINELEYIDGYIYANQWTYPFIYKIDPNTGFSVGRIDLSQAWDRIKAIDPQADVPNGIAYDADTKKIYVTGKKWPELYEIQLGQ